MKKGDIITDDSKCSTTNFNKVVTQAINQAVQDLGGDNGE